MPNFLCGAQDDGWRCLNKEVGTSLSTCVTEQKLGTVEKLQDSYPSALSFKHTMQVTLCWRYQCRTP